MNQFSDWIKCQNYFFNHWSDPVNEVPLVWGIEQLLPTDVRWFDENCFYCHNMLECDWLSWGFLIESYDSAKLGPVIWQSAHHISVDCFNSLLVVARWVAWRSHGFLNDRNKLAWVIWDFALLSDDHYIWFALRELDFVLFKGLHLRSLRSNLHGSWCAFSLGPNYPW
jgi:hypothetical protein